MKIDYNLLYDFLSDDDKKSFLVWKTLGNEYWLFRISGTTKANSDVESLNSKEVYDYFETPEETRDKKIDELLYE